jgi:hypothetical protein
VYFVITYNASFHPFQIWKNLELKPSGKSIIAIRLGLDSCLAHPYFGDVLTSSFALHIEYWQKNSSIS